MKFHFLPGNQVLGTSVHISNKVPKQAQIIMFVSLGEKRFLKVVPLFCFDSQWPNKRALGHRLSSWLLAIMRLGRRRFASIE